MASEFLRKKAQERAAVVDRKYGPDAYGGSKWREENSGGGKTAGGTSSSTGKKASSFLQQKAAERAAVVDKTYGADAYGGSKWRDEPTAQKHNYTSANEVQKKLDALRSSITEIEPVVLEKQKRLESTMKTLDRLAAQVKATPDNEKVYAAYKKFYDDYSKLWAEFEPLQAEYTNAVNAYNTEYDGWKSSIRSVADIDAALAALDEQAKKVKRDRSAYTSGAAYGRGHTDTTNLNKKADELTAELDEIEKQRALLVEEKQWSEHFSFADLMGGADFEEYAAKGAAIKNPTVEDANGWLNLMGWRPGAEEVSNIVTYSRENLEDVKKDEEQALRRRLTNIGSSVPDMTGGNVVGDSLYGYMTEDEVSIYNYLLAKEGKEAAQEYLDHLEEYLNSRKGAELGESVRGIDNGLGRTLATGAYGIRAGLDQFTGGMEQLFSREELPTSAIQYGSQYIQEDLADTKVAKHLYNATTTIGNMAPSILASAVLGPAGLGVSSAVAAGVGSATMGMSATGNAYGQALKAGYSEGQARAYSTLVGVSEAALQYALGGIGKLGGVADDLLLAKVNAINNGLARVSLTGAIKLGSEIAEEELQNFLEPLFAAWIFNENYDAPTIEELVETAIVTALSTGVLESGSIASAGSRQTAKLGANIKSMDGETVQAIIDEGLATPADSPSHILAAKLQQKLEQGQAITDQEIGNLQQQNEANVDMMADPDAALAEAAREAASREMRAEATETAQERVSPEGVETLAQTASEASTPTRVAMSAAAMASVPYNVLNNAQKAKTSVLDSLGYLDNGTRAFESVVETTGMSVKDVRSNFQTAYEAGLRNVPANSVSFVNPIQKAAYAAGLKDYGVLHKQAVERDAQMAQQAPVQSKAKSGFQYDAKRLPSNVSLGEATIIDELSRMLGVSTRVVGQRDYNAKLTGTTDVEIASDFQTEMTGADGILRKTTVIDHAVHEMAGHQVIKLAPAEGRAFMNAMYGYLSENLPDTVATLAEEKTASYGSKKVGLSTDKAMEEVVVSEIFPVLYSSDPAQFQAAMDRVMNGKDEQAKKGARTFKEVLNDLWKKLKSIAAKLRGKGDVDAAREAEQAADRVRELRDMFEDAMRVAAQRVQNAQKSANEPGRAEAGRDTMDYSMKDVATKFQRKFTGQVMSDQYIDLSSREKAAIAQALKTGYGRIDVDGQGGGVSAAGYYYLFDVTSSGGVRVTDVIDHNDLNIHEEKYGGVYDEEGRYDHKTGAAAESGGRGSGYGSERVSATEKARKGGADGLLAGAAQDRNAGRNLQEIQGVGENLTKVRDGKLFRVTEADGTTVLTTANDSPVAMMDENGSAQFSLKTYDAFGRAELKRWLDLRVEKKQIDKEDAADIVRQLDEYYDLCQKFLDKYAPFGAWSAAEVVRDNKGKPVFSVVKANGEYAMNLDFSLVCKKRRTLDAVFGEMIRRGMMDNVDLAEADIAKINDIIRESGFETACALCFVDAKRYRQAKVADTFVNQYNELVNMLLPEDGSAKAHYFDFVETGHYKNAGKGLHTLSNAEVKAGIDKLKQVMRENGSKTVPHKIAKHLLENPKDRRLVNRGEFMNTDGFGAVRLKNPAVLKLYNSSKGSGGPKAAFSDVQYLGEILQKNNFTPGRAYAVGGVRIQSFSDYIPRLVFDYLQMAADLSAKKLPAHAYTKEATFVKQFGMTGIKMNMSLVPAVAADGVAAGLDKNGNYYWFDGQSFGSDVGVKGSGQTGFELAIEIQNAPGYSEHCGTIAVGVSDEHIWKMLDDENIRMIIPYHKSSLNHIVAVMNNIDKYTDYTKVQNTRVKATGSKIAGKDFNFNEALQRLGDAKAAADEYLAWCEKNGYLPKFDTFAGHENYYKVLEDFSTYDNGVAAPQGPVTMTFPKEGDVFGSMAELIEQGLDEDAVLEGRRDKSLSSIVDKVEGVLKQRDDTQYSMKEQAKVMRDNARLKEVNAALKAQLQTTKFAKVDPKSLRSMARDLVKDYDSDADIDDIQSDLDTLYTCLANDDPHAVPATNAESMAALADSQDEFSQPSKWNTAFRMAYDIARSIVESANVLDDTLWREYEGLRNYLRTTGISMDRRYDGDLAGYENLNDFRKRNFGRIKIVNNGLDINTAYNELAGMYPGLFNDEAVSHPADQLTQLADVLDSLEPQEINPYGHEIREAATWLANDIMERFYELPQAKPTFADKAERRLTEQVIKDAKKMEQVRERSNERVSRIIAEYREKVKDVRKQEKAAKWEKVEKVKEHYKAKESKMSESRRARVLRERIIRHASELKQKLLRATDKKHIPQELQGAVAKLLECINLESKYEYAVGQDGRMHRVERGTAAHAEPAKRTQAFAELQAVYAQLTNELTIDPDLLGDDGLLNDVIKLADKPIASMTSEELQTIWETMRAVESSVRTANKTHNATRWDTVVEAAEALREDNKGKKDKVELRGIFGKGQKLTGLDMETPETYFRLLGKAGEDLFRMMRDAQDQHIRLMNEVSGFTHETLGKINVRKLESEMHDVTLGGEKVKLSTAQIMEMYVLMKREQALDHIFVGGILPDVVSAKGLKKITKAKPVRGISLSEVSKAVNQLTEEQRKIADQMQGYASNTLSKWGNKASMDVYGYEKFGEKNYWPIRVNRQEIKSDVQKDTAVTSLANRSFTKGTRPHANNSLRLGSIFDTFATHSSEMATYSAWLGTLDDINRIRNFTFKDEDSGHAVDTVKGIIDTVHGTSGNAYLDKLLSDVTNGVKGTHGETAYMSGLVGNFKAAAVGANLRVIIQQPTAMLRAADMIGAQYMAIPGNPIKGWNKAKKYAPIAVWKDWGYFDINTGRQMKDVLFDSDTAVDKVKSITMWGAGAMDSLAWGQLWNAAEAETKAKRKELKPDTEAFYEAVAKRFTEIVDHTQVVDGILQRSQIMRSADSVTKMATSFMGEPTKQYNMMMQAAYDAKKTSGKDRKGAVKKLVRTASVLAISGVANAMAQSIIDAVRDDDKEKEYWEKWLASFKENLGSTFNPVSYVPFAKDILSILQGYDVSRMDMESVEKLVSAGQNMIKALSGEGKYTVGGAAINLVAEIARLVGIPVANLKREITSFAMLAAVENDNYLMQYRMEKWMLNMNGNSGKFVDILFNAYQNDKAAYEIIYADMVGSGFDPEKIKTSMETRMKKDQGVNKVGDLEQRYLTPSQQPKYDELMGSVHQSNLWGSADEEQRDNLEARAYTYIAGDSKTAQDMVEEIEVAKTYGIDETEYLLYKLALEMYDTPNKSGELGGTPTNEEKAVAIQALGNLSDGEIAYLWDTEKGYEAYASGVDMGAYVDYLGAGGTVNLDKMIDAQENGIGTEKYIDFLDMLDKFDQPTESGKMGSFTQDEATAAIAAMTGLTNAQRAYLWQSVNKGWKSKNNPWQ